MGIIAAGISALFSTMFSPQPPEVKAATISAILAVMTAGSQMG